jgi:hypothetical protein
MNTVIGCYISKPVPVQQNGWMLEDKTASTILDEVKPVNVIHNSILHAIMRIKNYWSCEPIIHVGNNMYKIVVVHSDSTYTLLYQMAVKYSQQHARYIAINKRTVFVLYA